MPGADNCRLSETSIGLKMKREGAVVTTQNLTDFRPRDLVRRPDKRLLL